MAREKSIKPKAKRITLEVRSEPGSIVTVAGDFNDWNPERQPMEDKDGTGLYATNISLLPGTYEYKFVINGTWCMDADCKEWVQTPLGTLNSVLRVQ